MSMGAARKRKKQRKIETSKKLAWWAVMVATATVAASYVLAWNGLESVETLSGTVFTACIGYLITYAGKSLGEKVSRNRYGLDANGRPIANTNDESEAKG